MQRQSCSLDLSTMDEADPRSKLGWSLEVQLTSDSSQDLEAAKTFISGLQGNPHFAQIAGPSSHIAQAVEGVAAAIESQTPLQKALETLLSKLSTVQSLVAVVDEIAKIHPYVNAAWQIVSAMYRAIKAQHDRDQKIIELVDAMSYLHGLLSKIMPQIWECALFVQEYIADGFAKRLKHQSLSDCTQKIADMKDNLFKLRNSLDSGTIVHAAVTSSKILETVHDIYLRDHLKPAEMNVFYRKECLSGTRQEVIGSILDQLLNPDTNQRILWMHGPAGSGKSTIATTIANHFVKEHRSGAFVFFDRSRAEASRPEKVIRTMAYKLGLHDLFVQAALAQAVKNEGDIDSLQPSVQFSKLLIEPLQSAQSMHTRLGPIIIVIDALDECGTAEERKTLLQLLSEDVVGLPSNYHFFITSRPEYDIVKHFSQKSHIKEMTLDITLQSNQKDIHIFLEQSVFQIQQNRSYLPSDWPGKTTMEILLKKAAGLFIWASTAVIFVDQHDEDPRDQLEIILTSRNREETESSLDSLYETVLQTMRIWSKPHSRIAVNWHKVLGLLVVAKAPLTDVMIDEMLDLKDAQCSQLFFQQLRSLLNWSPGHTVQLVHASIADYLTDRSRCGDKPWFIDIAIHNDNMTRACLHIMQTQLHFNICNLETSYVFNKDVSDLSQRIDINISGELSYSCQFWPDHFANSMFRQDTCDLVVDFFSRYLLFWIEVMSLLKCPLSPKIDLISHLCQNDLFNSWIQDIQAFISMFHLAYTQSTPHLYISCLPFCPAKSKAVKYHASTLCTLIVQTGRKEDWSTDGLVIPNDASVESVAFSPDGKHIVSGSSAKTVRVWNASTGEPVSDPFTGHTDCVT
ncbi:hypothetical protein B0H21DRAFT_201833, partial [Amylocystis lapponica]